MLHLSAALLLLALVTHYVIAAFKMHSISNRSNIKTER